MQQPSLLHSGAELEDLHWQYSWEARGPQAAYLSTTDATLFTLRKSEVLGLMSCMS